MKLWELNQLKGWEYGDRCEIGSIVWAESEERAREICELKNAHDPEWVSCAELVLGDTERVIGYHSTY